MCFEASVWDDFFTNTTYNIKNIDKVLLKWYTNIMQNGFLCNVVIANAYDSFENIIKEAFFNRIGERKLFDKKIGITYLYDVYTNVRYAGNMNNIKLKG